MKKVYNQPNVELVQLMPTTMILAGSPGGSGLPYDPTPIPGSGGGD